MAKLLVLSTMCFLLSGRIEYIFGQNISSHQKVEIERQVDSVFHRMIIAAESLEYDKLAQGVDDEYNTGFISNGSFFMRFDSLLNFVKTKSQGVTKQAIIIQQQKITVLSENIVLLTACGDAKIDVSSGNPFAVKFFWSFVYKRINDEWKVIQSHQSSIR